MYTVQHCASSQCHVIRSHIRRVYVCLAVTFHLHLWQNDRDIFYIFVLFCCCCYCCGNTGVERIPSQQRKLTLERKNLSPLLPRLEPETFRSRVGRCITEPSLLPVTVLCSSSVCDNSSVISSPTCRQFCGRELFNWQIVSSVACHILEMAFSVQD